MERVLTAWVSHHREDDESLARDGKTVHGSGAAGDEPIHLLSISTHRSGETLLQVQVAA